jgi:hypothetical protein
MAENQSKRRTEWLIRGLVRGAQSVIRAPPVKSVMTEQRFRFIRLISELTEISTAVHRARRSVTATRDPA